MKFSIGQEHLSNLLNENRTPLYIYSKSVIKKTIEEIKQAFSADNFQLLFATMANDNDEFLKTIWQCGTGACVNSITHLEKVIKCGFDPGSIQFTSTGIPAEEMHLLSNYKIAVNVDSIGQLKQWLSISKIGKVGIRINSSSLAPGVCYSDRLGISIYDIPQALNVAEALGGTINGLHIYVGTDYKDHDKMLNPIKRLFELAETIPTIEYLNIGGGVGVQYLNDTNTFDLFAFGRTVSELKSAFDKKTDSNVRLIFEPGRRIAAGSGLFITKVTDIKVLEDTKFLVVDASVAIFPRPLHQPHSPHNVVSFTKGPFQDAVIVGKTTFSKDILGRVSLPNNVEVGDVLIFEQAGAYCDSMRSKFLGQYEPANIFV